jgi:AcrR family transcriptional regulator
LATREEGKQRRRRDIVRAAHRLVQRTGDTGFSMRTLAEEAGVSIATPYNLFGSKQAVMYAVLDADIDAYQRRLEHLRADETEVFFKAVTLATGLFAHEPAFYRTVLFAVYSDGGREYRAMFSGPRHAMWRRLVVAARDAQVLVADVEPDAFALQLGRSFFAAIMEWVLGELSIEELEISAHYAFALLLLSMATPASAPALRLRTQNLQENLKSCWRAPTGATNGSVRRAAG